MEFKKEHWLWYVYPTKDITPIVKIEPYDLFIFSDKPELYSFGFHHLTMMNITHKVYKGNKVFVVDTKEFVTVTDKVGGLYICDDGNTYGEREILSVDYSTDKSLTYNLFCETPYPFPLNIVLKNAVDHLNQQFILKSKEKEKTYTKDQVINEVINLIQLYSCEKGKVLDIRSWVQENIDL